LKTRIITFKKIISLFILLSLFSASWFLFSCKDAGVLTEEETATAVSETVSQESLPEETSAATETTVPEPPENYYVSDLDGIDNYSFICPEEWLLYESGSGKSVVISSNAPSESKSENIYIYIEDEIAAKGLSDDQSIAGAYKNIASGEPSAVFLESQEIKFAGADTVLEGYTYSSRLEEDWQQEAVCIDLFTYINHDDVLYCIKYTGLNSDVREAEEFFKEFLETFSIGQEKEKIKQKDENSRINILILGDDSGLGRPGGRVNGRTDIIILLHLNLDTAKGTAVTIPRDTWVDIPGHGKGKITEAHAMGGNELSVKAVEGLSGLEIDNYIITDMDGFSLLIDFLGGVTTEVGEDIADGFSGCYLSKGIHHLNGEQALALSRCRYRKGDGTTLSGAFAREREAAKIIVGLIDQKSTFERIIALPVLVNFLLNYTWTDMRFTDIIKLLPVLGRIKAADIEITGIPSWTATIGKASAVEYDVEATAELFEEINMQ